MPKGTNSKTHNIFLLDRSKIEKSFFNEEVTPFSDIINKIIDNAMLPFREQELQDNLSIGDFHIRLFFYGDYITADSKLASFCRSFVKDDQEVFKIKPCSISSILFVWNDNRLFAVTTGQGFRAVESLCVPKFGLLVVSTFEKVFRITGLDSNGMSSIIHSNRTIYSNEVDFINVEALDTVYKEITGRLNDKEKVKELLNLDKKSKKRSMKVIAKNYIQFSSSMNLQGLLHLLNLISQYDLEGMQDKFNLISPINNKNHADIVKNNNEKVIQELYHAIINELPITFDLFNHDTNAFIGADKYILSINRKDSLAETEEINPTQFISEAYNVFLDGSVASIASFSEFIFKVRLISYKEDFPVTDEKLLKHISGEIEVNGRNYYIFYGEYYYLNDAYSARLNRSLGGKLTSDRYSDIIRTKWKRGENEDTFNYNVSVNEKFVYLHRLLVDNIEFADLLRKESNGDISIVHVKDGFDKEMRTLDRQVELSIAQILDLKNNNNEKFMRNLYKEAELKPNGTTITSVFSTEDSFIQALRENTLRYIIVIRPANKALINSTSNIAKHCLNALILRCFNQGIDLKIAVV